MVKKTKYLKLYISKYKETLSKHYKTRKYSPLCFNRVSILWLCLSLACQSNSVTSPPSTKNNDSSSAKSDEITLPVKDSQKNIQCDSLANRIDELDSLILRKEQTANQALSQAKESCRGDSAVDCGFWTERANGLARQIRELRQQHQRLTSQKSQNGCMF